MRVSDYPSREPQPPDLVISDQQVGEDEQKEATLKAVAFFVFGRHF